jgi:hypothetical protein
MPAMSRWSWLALLIVAWPTQAFAQSSDDATKRCVTAYERAQELRLEKRLLEAREQLRICTAAECPDVARRDCGTWLDDVEQALPSVVLRFVDDAGEERKDVTVTLDDEPFAERLDGTAMVLDPGPHRFVFTPAGGAPVTKEVIVAEGEQRRAITIDQSPAPAPQPPAPKAPPPERSVHPVAWILYGTSALALGGFIGFGVHSLGLEDCKPNCTDDQVDDVVLFRAVADVSLGVSALALGGAIWITIASLTGDDPVDDTVQVSVLPTPTGVTGGMSLRF